MTRLYGRSEIGKRLIGYAPFNHWKTTTFLAALRHDGLTAPCVFEGAINGEKFAAYIEQELVGMLRPGDIVIMDNLEFTSLSPVKFAIRSRRRRTSEVLSRRAAPVRYLPGQPPHRGDQGDGRHRRLLQGLIEKREVEVWRRAALADGLGLSD